MSNIIIAAMAMAVLAVVLPVAMTLSVSHAVSSFCYTVATYCNQEFTVKERRESIQRFSCFISTLSGQQKT